MKIRLLLALLVILLTFSASCRDRERKPEVTMQDRLLADAARRYIITNAKGERALVLKQRGLSFVLADGNGNTRARASLMRGDQTVLVRNAEGAVVGQTSGDPKTEITLQDPNKATLAVLKITASELTLEQSGQLRWRFETHDNGGVTASSPTGEGFVLVSDDATPQGWRIKSSAEADSYLRSIEGGSKLSAMGFALLHSQALDLPLLLGLAVHLDALALPSG